MAACQHRPDDTRQRMWPIEFFIHNMSLNGWQRLWVLLSVLLAIAAVVYVLVVWPQLNNLPDGDVYWRMPADLVRHLKIDDRTERVSWLEQRRVIETADYIWHVFPADSSDAEIVMTLTNGGRHDLSADTSVPSNRASADPLKVLAITPPDIEVEGRTLRFVPLGPAWPDTNYDPSVVAASYKAALHRALRMERLFVGISSFGCWLGVVVSVYIFGWSVAWVRRGFSRLEPR